MRCDICGCTIEGEPVFHNIYAIGSEGIRVCPACSRHISDFVRMLRSLCAHTRLDQIKKSHGKKAPVRLGTMVATDFLLPAYPPKVAKALQKASEL